MMRKIERTSSHDILSNNMSRSRCPCSWDIISSKPYGHTIYLVKTKEPIYDHYTIVIYQKKTDSIFSIIIYQYLFLSAHQVFSVQVLIQSSFSLFFVVVVFLAQRIVNYQKKLTYSFKIGQIQKQRHEKKRHKKWMEKNLTRCVCVYVCNSTKLFIKIPIGL